MSNKKGHPKYFKLRKALHEGNQIFTGYPHRRHRTSGKRIIRSCVSIKKERELAHMNNLEEEIKELI